MKPNADLVERRIFGEIIHNHGQKTLQVRVYREYNAFVCERVVVERDGSTYTQTLAVRSLAEVTSLLHADPYYPDMRARVDFLLNRLAVEMLASEAQQPNRRLM
jgi:hypothetical protein